MSDGGVVFKRTKSKPIQRAREKSPDDSDTPTTLASKLKKRAKPKARLSFGGDDDEEEAFQVKKSNLSRKLTLGTHPASKGNLITLDQATITTNRGPTYDKAYLSELKASTPSGRPSQSHDEDIVMDIVESVDSLVESDTYIPSESSILVAKQKRERLRATTAAGEEDFISLSVVKRSDEPQGPHPESRLVREEDELGEGEDEFAEYTSATERIALGKKSKKVEATKRRDHLKEMIADAEEEDEETLFWEQEQLRRGGNTTKEPPGKSQKPTYKPAPIPENTPVPSLGPALARLSQALSDLTTSHTKNTQKMSATADERTQVDARETEMRAMVEKAEGKRSWFMAFSGWVEDIATFLDDKFPLVEELEKGHISILKERAEMVDKRRQSDDEDDLTSIYGQLPMDTEQVDDLGRSPVARQERRASRRKRRTSSQEEGYSTDGSLSTPDQLDYTSAIRKLSIDASKVLEDVRSSEFKNPSKGLVKWFGEWRDKYGESYTGAWGGLGLVGAWEFWVRLELIGWNPLDDNTKTLDEFTWYSSLYDYSRPDGEDGLGPDGDLVAAMISTAVVPRLCKMVEAGSFDPYSARSLRKVIDLCEQVEASVEADSPKLQNLLKSTVGAFEAAVNTAEHLVAACKAVRTQGFDPEAIPARRRFLARRIKLLQNLLRWRKYSGDKFGVNQLCVRLLSSTLMPVANGGWEVGGEEDMRKVAQMMPPELIPHSLSARLRT